MWETKVEPPKTILNFINNFKSCKETFLCGMCYWFAHILQARFGGTMMYAPVDNHFVQKIGGRIYDVSGDVTDDYGSSTDLIPWFAMEAYDKRLYQRIVRDCILKAEGKKHVP